MLTFLTPNTGAPQRSSLGRMVTQSTMLLMFSIGLIIVILSVVILFHQNATATKGYNLRRLERDRSKLLLKEEELNMKVAKAQSLEKLENDKVIQAMVPVRNPVYAELDTTVAWSDKQE